METPLYFACRPHSAVMYCRPEDVHVPLDWHAENLALAIERTEIESSEHLSFGMGQNPDE